jgi:hypothetical protein
MMMRKKPLVAIGTALTVTLGAGLGSTGCLDRPIDRLEPRTTSTVVERLTQTGVDKIDLLLAIDNSISMADKQAILAAAVPDLVDRLVQPICVDDMGVANGTKVDAMGECAMGKPEFPPVTDINVGIISSSLGALTAKQCDGLMGMNPSSNDKGHLLNRGGTGTVPTYANLGFLAWDPGAKRVPAGETDATTFTNNLRDMVVGVGQVGCGYEMQLESIVHFLADPEPYDKLIDGGSGQLTRDGVDQTIIQQRKDFMRSNSLLAIIILSDENDCSIDIGGQGKLVLEQGQFYKSTEECAADPTDKCCTSCALKNPDKCAPDPSCGAQGTKDADHYTATEDSVNLRCFNQKQKYGVDFLYPVQRYVNAFTLPQIDATASTFTSENTVQNPIFSDLSGAGLPVRGPGLVFVAGIVGVPWQAIARDPADLTKGFKNYSELAQDNAFDKLVGDPDKQVKPTDPFLQESIDPRTGVADGNPQNTNDRAIPNRDDIQYTCIFPLDAPVPNGNDCDDCILPGCDNPLCDLTGTPTTQTHAKAYPGLREMAVLRGMGDQGIFASICPANTTNTGAADYGYRPAVGAIIDRLKTELGGQCLPRQLTPDSEGNVPCLVLEASATNGNCVCDPPRVAIPASDPKYNAVKAAQNDQFKNDQWDCFCEVQQLTGADREACQTQQDAQVDGWCYIDPAAGAGSPDLVANCPPNEKRIVRFVGAGEPQSGATVFITCSGE